MVSKLIDMVNENVKTTDGRLIFIDDDRRHIYDLHYDIRFVETGKRILSNYREFAGFIMGILSMDSDIRTIYIDGLTNIIETIDNESLVKLGKRLSDISKQHSVDFVISINYNREAMPDELKENLI